MFSCAKNIATIIDTLGGLEALAARPIRIESATMLTLVLQHHGPSPLRSGSVLVSMAFVRPENEIELTNTLLVFEIDPSDDTPRGWRSGAWLPVHSYDEYQGFPAMTVAETGKIRVRPRADWVIAEWRGAARTFNQWVREDGYLDTALQIAADRRAFERAEQHRAGRKRRGTVLRSA